VGVAFSTADFFDECTKYRLDCPVKIEPDVSVPEAHDSIAPFFEPLRPFSIAFVACTFSMLETVDLDDKPSLEADEVDDVGANWMLAPEATAGEPFVSQLLPDDPLFLCGVPA
jgi:hypothetical protein